MEQLVAVRPEIDAAVTTAQEGQLNVENTEGRVSSSQMKVKLKEELVKLCTPTEDLMLFVKLYSPERVIADIECICDLLFSHCACFLQ